MVGSGTAFGAIGLHKRLRDLIGQYLRKRLAARELNELNASEFRPNLKLEKLARTVRKLPGLGFGIHVEADGSTYEGGFEMWGPGNLKKNTKAESVLPSHRSRPMDWRQGTWDRSFRTQWRCNLRWQLAWKHEAPWQKIERFQSWMDNSITGHIKQLLVRCIEHPACVFLILTQILQPTKSRWYERCQCVDNFPFGRWNFGNHFAIPSVSIWHFDALHTRAVQSLYSLAMP